MLLSLSAHMLHSFAFRLVNWFRLTDLAILSVFFALILTASLLFTELDDRIEDILNSTNNKRSQISFKLNRWKRQHHLVCQLVDCINDTFGLIVLIQIGYIVTEMTIFSAAFMIRFKFGCEFLRLDDINGELSIFQNNTMAYFHVFFRLLIISVSSWILQNKVILEYS